MNRINRLFKEKKHNIMSIYFCAGAPKSDNVTDIIATLESKGIDMVEIGIPFSDPMADGPVIQEASTIALKNGMNIRTLFEQLDGIREKVRIPLIMMGYLNPIIQFGIERFCKKCKETGIDGVIIPDLPFEEYQTSFRCIAEKFDLKVIMLITPETSEERIRLIDDNTDGFIYMVSSAAVTGAQKKFDNERLEYFNKVNQMNLKNPRMIGFGIANKNTFDSACTYASGCIIGSKFVKLLIEAEGNTDNAISKLFIELSK